MTEKVLIPDGLGGWKEVEATPMAGRADVDAEKQAQVLAQQYYEDAGYLAEQLGKFATGICRERGLTPEHLAFGISLLAINIREDFPAENGGPLGFDTQASAAGEYYDRHIDEVRRQRGIQR